MDVVSINVRWCKGCGICVAFCPKKALSIEGEKARFAAPDKCIACGMCELYCPDLAITVDASKMPPKPEKEVQS